MNVRNLPPAAKLLLLRRAVAAEAPRNRDTRGGAPDRFDAPRGHGGGAGGLGNADSGGGDLSSGTHIGFRW